MIWRTYAVLAAACVIFLLVVGGMAAQTAEAHPLPKSSGVKIGLHRICTALKVCKDRAPKMIDMPGTLCERANEGEIVTVFDRRLGVEVDWQCRCPNEVNCTWFRVGIRQSVFTAFWRVQDRRYVLDWQRACPSIVCKGRLVKHYYPLYRGRTL
jgi:hypothetical protein